MGGRITAKLAPLSCLSNLACRRGNDTPVVPGHTRHEMAFQLGKSLPPTRREPRCEFMIRRALGANAGQFASCIGDGEEHQVRRASAACSIVVPTARTGNAGRGTDPPKPVAVRSRSVRSPKFGL